MIYNLSELKIYKMNLADSFKYKHQCTQFQSEDKCDNTEIQGQAQDKTSTEENPEKEFYL